MLETVLSAGAVLAAEAAVRAHINAQPPGTYPRMLTKHIELRRAHNRGLVGGRLADRPALATALQTGAAVFAVGLAVLANLPALQVRPVARVGAGLAAGGAWANTLERYIKHEVTDYVYLKDAILPLLRRRIWNLADLAIFNGMVVAAAGFLSATIEGAAYGALGRL